MSLQATHHFDITNSFNIDEQITFSELSQRTRLPENDVRLLLRMAVANYVFPKPSKTS